MKVVRLMTEFQEQPLGIAVKDPSFSWNLMTGERDVKQKAFRILTARDEEFRELVWDSGVRNSDWMINVRYEGQELLSDTRYYWKVTVWTNKSEEPCGSETAFFETSLYEKEDWHGIWLGETEDHVYHIFRKEFELEKKPVRARLYVCGLGHYEFYLNGKRASDAVLEPGWTNYDKSCLYSCLDVTELLSSGKNAAGLILGDGMFNVPGGRYVYFERSYGKCKFLVQLNLTFEDGTKTEIVSDMSWRMAESALTFSCIYGGEDFDGRKKKKGFTEADYTEDTDWVSPVKTDPPKGALTAQNIYPLKVMKIYQPVSIKEIQPGVFLYDFGTNLSGWASIRLRAEGPCEGCVVTMTPGEILDADQVPDQRVTGRGYHWQYTMNGETLQEYRPKFTYTGFRYVMLTGAVPEEFSRPGDARPVAEAVTAEFIYPDQVENGGFACSNELFNQIHQIIRQAMLSNMKSYMTDCPHREKLSWLEQSHLIGPGIMYNFNVHNLYEKLERDMKESQRQEGQEKPGLIPDICPEYVVFGYHEGFVDSPEWGSACIINPWYLYKRFGDETIFSRYYDVMKKYMDYLTSRTHHCVLHHGLGDWLDIGPMTPYSQNTPVPVIATTVYYYDLGIMKRVAQMLGYEEDAREYGALMEQVKEEYNLQFFDDQTNRYANGSQAAQAMSLMAGLVASDREQKVLDMLVKDIEKRGYATTAGDVGYPFVVAALMKYGRSDILNAMTNVTDKPGYGYQVKCGATTLTEDWDGPDPAGPHGSQNHLMLGSIEEWFYGGLAGLNSIRTDNPFDVILIRPHFAEGIDEVKAWTMHPYGKLTMHWKKEADGIRADFEIPAGAEAIFVNEKTGEEIRLGSGAYSYLL